MSPAKTYLPIIYLACAIGFPGLSIGQSQLSTSKALFEERNFEKAKVILQSMPADQKDYAEGQYYLGRIAVEEKQYDLSVAKFEEAIELNPGVAEYHNWLGVMYGVVAIESNPLKQAYLAPRIKNEFEKAAAIDPDNIQTQWGLVNYYVKAPGFLGGSWEKALTSAKNISRLDKPQGMRAYAFVHAAQNKPDQAEKEYKSAIQAEPTNCDHVFALARFYEDQKKYDKAMGLYEGVINNYPKNMVAAFYLGQASAHSGHKIEQGIHCLQQYLLYRPKPNEPTHSVAHLSLAMIYEKKGDLPQAKKYYESSLLLHPGMREAREGLQRVN